MIQEYSEVLTFWFETIQPAQWWQKDLEFDALIQKKFGELHQAAAQCECYSWRENAKGRLAEVIVLDQFSRNIYRDDARAFACDSLALGLSQEAIMRGDDQRLSEQERLFLYMPYMHSESSLIHQQAVNLFENLGLQQNLDFELKHKAIIDRFGRYPHRNSVLGRQSTQEELAFLEEPDSSF